MGKHTKRAKFYQQWKNKFTQIGWKNSAKRFHIIAEKEIKKQNQSYYRGRNEPS